MLAVFGINALGIILNLLKPAVIITPQITNNWQEKGHLFYILRISLSTSEIICASKYFIRLEALAY
jgi:hypothetical protein